ncbi:MAG: 2,5-dichloro-2,5-cyclohexadiene-1,4-diol dehydrogenase (2,5-ddol dehydrogenase), partial [Acidobacteria bacterium]|nr:2,5-dichloro-2,5-cyclohexadiene-1,4-diol dehydrogenase (2,5-ddol dehydrogenase) [Acidobacteriota bacterium]
MGAAIARRFCEEGAFVFVADVNKADGARSVRSLDRAAFVWLDVTSEESWKAALTEVLDKAKRLDILVNNAGINIRKNIEEMPVESLDAMMAVNIKGPFLGIKHALPILRAG